MIALVPCKIANAGFASERIGEIDTISAGPSWVVGDKMYFYPRASDPTVGEVEAHFVREDAQAGTVDLTFPDGQMFTVRREGVSLMHEVMPLTFIQRVINPGAAS